MFRSIIALAGFCVLGCGPSVAFWERSHLQACKEAQTQVAREQLRCWIFAPAYEWPRPVSGEILQRPPQRRFMPAPPPTPWR